MAVYPQIQNCALCETSTGFQARPTSMDPTWAVHHSCASWAPKNETSPAAYGILSIISIQLCSWLLKQIPYG